MRSRFNMVKCLKRNVQRSNSTFLTHYTLCLEWTWKFHLLQRGAVWQRHSFDLTHEFPHCREGLVRNLSSFVFNRHKFDFLIHPFLPLCFSYCQLVPMGTSVSFSSYDHFVSNACPGWCMQGQSSSGNHTKNSISCGFKPSYIMKALYDTYELTSNTPKPPEKDGPPPFCLPNP